MNRWLRATLSLVFVGIAMVWMGSTSTSVAAGPAEKAKPLHARAVISGPGGIFGEVDFKQHACDGCPTPADDKDDKEFKHFPEPTVDVDAHIFGPPAALGVGAHGIHIHEVGVCDPTSFATAGSHFDPGPFGHNVPVDANHPYHMGDLPNLIVNHGGEGHLKHTTSRITLSPGPLSVFDANGSAVVVHLNPDRGMTGVTGASGGPRIACGVILLVND
jgi:hypothetical protein